MVVVAAGFPEAGLVEGEEFDAAQPLGAFPQIDFRHDHPHRAAMLGGDRLALPAVDQQDVVLGEGFQLQVASFKDQADADRTVEDLRKRGFTKAETGKIIARTAADLRWIEKGELQVLTVPDWLDRVRKREAALHKALVDVSGEPFVDLAEEAKMAFARD